MSSSSGSAAPRTASGSAGPSSVAVPRARPACRLVHTRPRSLRSHIRPGSRITENATSSSTNHRWPVSNRSPPGHEREVRPVQPDVEGGRPELQVRLVVIEVAAKPEPHRDRDDGDRGHDQRHEQAEHPGTQEPTGSPPLQRVPGAQPGDQEQRRHRPDHRQRRQIGGHLGGLVVLDVVVVIGVEDQRGVEEHQPDDERPQHVQLAPAAGARDGQRRPPGTGAPSHPTTRSGFFHCWNARRHSAPQPRARRTARATT